jgi:hypothetical protein
MRQALLLCAVAVVAAGAGLSSASGGGRAPTTRAGLDSKFERMPDPNDPKSWTFRFSVDHQVDYIGLREKNDAGNAITSGMPTGGTKWDGCGMQGDTFVCFTVTTPVPAHTLESFHVTFRNVPSKDATIEVVSGPSVQSPPTVEGDIPLVAVQQPCKCLKLEGRIVPKSIAFVNPGERGGMHMEFTVHWVMTCLKGDGGCEGQLTLAPANVPPGTRLEPPNGVIKCNGPCAATTDGAMKFVLIGGRQLGGDRRGHAVKSIKIRMKRSCQGRNLKVRVFTLVFDPRTALVDKKASNLTGKSGR